MKQLLGMLLVVAASAVILGGCSQEAKTDPNDPSMQAKDYNQTLGKPSAAGAGSGAPAPDQAGNGAAASATEAKL